MNYRNISLFGMIFLFLIIVGFSQSWNVAFGLLNLCLLSAIMALGVNIQWGYAGLFSIGTVGFVALGGVAAVVTSMPPVEEAWRTGGPGILTAMLTAIVTIIAATQIWKRVPPGIVRNLLMIAVLVGGFFLFRGMLDPAAAIIEKINPAGEGYLGGLGLPVIFSWLVGGLFAAGAAWVIGKISLGLRADYLAIATLGIAEIIIAVIKNEDWLTRGVKNVIGIPRPTAYEVDLQKSETFINNVNWLGMEVIEASSLYVKFSYGILFVIVLAIILWMSEKALNSPWGRMMRAIRDNEVAAEALGKNVNSRHLQVFVLGSAVCGVAGAMLVTLDGQLTPTSYHPLRFTFIIWVMVIVGGSGNNLGSILGGFIIWFFWIEVETIGHFIMDFLTSGFSESNAFRIHMLNSAAYMRYLTLGLILLLVLRFSPRGLIPEK